MALWKVLEHLACMLPNSCLEAWGGAKVFLCGSPMKVFFFKSN